MEGSFEKPEGYRFSSLPRFFIIKVDYFFGDSASFAYFLVDTGSTHTIVTQHISSLVAASEFTPSQTSSEKGLLARLFRRKPMPNYEEMRIKTAAGEIDAPQIVLSKIKLLGKEVSSVKALCVHSKPGDPFDRFNYDGILGTDVLSRFNVCLDYEKQLLTLEEFK